jgi:hypothetical protein
VRCPCQRGSGASSRVASSRNSERHGLAPLASAAVSRGGRTARAQGAAALFVAYLRRHGVLPPIVPQARPEEVWPVLAAFRSWMREQRGAADSTLNKYQSILADLLAVLGEASPSLHGPFFAIWWRKDGGGETRLDAVNIETGVSHPFSPAGKATASAP